MSPVHQGDEKTLKNTYVTQQVEVLFWMLHRRKGSLKHKICIGLNSLVRLVTKRSCYHCGKPLIPLK